MTTDYAGLIRRLRQRLGPNGILTDPADTDPYCEDWRRLYHGRTPAVLRPVNTAEVADAVRLCAEARVPIVPMGGNTSMVGGAAVSEDGSQIVLSLSRMNRVRGIDPVRHDHGDRGRGYPEGGADRRRGGRLPAAAIDQLRRLGADRRGAGDQCRRQQHGALRQCPRPGAGPRSRAARRAGVERAAPPAQGQYRLLPTPAVCRQRRDARHHHRRGAEAVPAAARDRGRALRSRLARGGAAALSGLSAARSRGGPAFEYMSGAGMALVERYIPDAKPPLAAPAAHYVLLELAKPREGAGLRGALEELLGKAMNSGVVTDAVIAESGPQRAAIWKLREEHSEAQKRAGASVKNDISVPVSRVPELIRRATVECERLVPGIRCVPFGHLGDGNIHFNLVQREGADSNAFLARDHELMDAVNDIVRDLDGSFSAEHGIGRLKPYMMPEWRGGAELDLMRRIKTALDPAGLFNPGKMLP